MGRPTAYLVGDRVALVVKHVVTRTCVEVYDYEGEAQDRRQRRLKSS